jgi:hypothetical protein
MKGIGTFSGCGRRPQFEENVHDMHSKKEKRFDR